MLVHEVIDGIAMDSTNVKNAIISYRPVEMTSILETLSRFKKAPKILKMKLVMVKSS